MKTKQPKPAAYLPFRGLAAKPVRHTPEDAAEALQIMALKAERYWDLGFGKTQPNAETTWH